MARRGNRLHAYNDPSINFYRRSRYLFPAAEFDHVLDLQQSEAVQKAAVSLRELSCTYLAAQNPNHSSELLLVSSLSSDHLVVRSCAKRELLTFVGSHCLADLPLFVIGA